MIQALFDMDDTLVDGDVPATFLRYLAQQGIVEHALLEQGRRYLADYNAGTLDFEDYIRFELLPQRLLSAEQYQGQLSACIKSTLLPLVSDTARAWIAAHHQAGHTVALVTASNAQLAQPIAQALGIEHALGTPVSNGELAGEPCYREGKINAVHAWRERQRFSAIERTWFYSDSRNDIPLLSTVSDPVCVDPDPTLLAHAETQAWTIVSKHDPYRALF